MIIGIPKEVKDNEKRVSLTPYGVSELKKRNHTILIEKDAGLGSGFADEKYNQFGATLVDNRPDIFSKSDMIIKVKEPQPDEIKLIKENQIKGIVVGNPINMDGSSGKSSQSALDFAKNISNNITIPITMWDERLSSEGVFNITRNLGTNVSNRLNKLDKNAAAFILQGAIDYLSNN